MCTVSWRIGEHGFDLFFNRDERRTRLPGHLPQVRQLGKRRVISPADGNFGGTWVSVNERGIALALLNGYTPTDDSADRTYESRGILVSDLSDADSATEVMQRLESADLQAFRSFRLLVLEPNGSLLADWRDPRLTLLPPEEIRSPLVSSSFDTVAVRRSRVAQFTALVSKSSTPEIDDHLRFHSGHQPERGAFSVCMHRADARTVSFSWIQVTPESVRFLYTPHAPHAGVNRDDPVCFPRSDQ